MQVIYNYSLLFRRLVFIVLPRVPYMQPLLKQLLPSRIVIAWKSVYFALIFLIYGFFIVFVGRTLFGIVSFSRFFVRSVFFFLLFTYFFIL